MSGGSGSGRRLFRSATLTKKCVCAICLAAVLMLLLVVCRMDDWIYARLKPQLQHSVSMVVSAVSTRISYILHQNTQYLLGYWLNEDLMQMTQTYLEGDAEDSERLYGEIVQALREEARGAMEPGAIRSSRRVFLWADGSVYLGSGELQPYAEYLMHSGWYERLPSVFAQLTKDNPGDLARCYSPVYNPGNGMESFLAYAMPRTWQGHEIFLVMIEPFSDFETLLADLEETEGTDVALIGYGGELLFTNIPDSVFAEMPEQEMNALFQKDQYEANLVENESYTLLGVRISYQIEQMRLALCLSREDFLRPYQAFLSLTGKILIGFTAALIFVIVLILQKTLSGVRQLSEQMQEVKQGNYEVSCSIRGTDEVGMLADTFCQMMAEIRRNMETIRVQEKKEKRIQYSLLVSQINPHFIYNTLNTITYLAKLNRTGDIMTINKALIRMLRDRLQISKLQIFDTIEHEQQQTEAYLTIQRYLCSGEIDYEFKIAPNCREIRYPKNVIQPFVENAILHGILLHRDEEGRLIPGRIRILVMRTGDTVYTKICDNGIGMNAEQIREFFEREPVGPAWDNGEEKTQEHVGISNIRMRMQYLYGDGFRIQASMPEEGGLQICFQFPERI